MDKYIDEIIYGGMDGILTTVSIISGVYGSNINVVYAFILGIANLLADGFSMGISRYLSLSRKQNNINAIIRGLYTFLSFCILGGIPVLSLYFCIDSVDPESRFCNGASILFLFVTTLCFVLIGYIKALYMTKTYMKTITETLMIGFIGVYISYYVSYKMKEYLIK